MCVGYEMKEPTKKLNMMMHDKKKLLLHYLDILA